MKNRFNFTAHHSLNFWVLIIQVCLWCILPDHLNAQCKDNQNNVEFSYYNIMLVMDQSYIDAHGGNVVDSRSAAITVADAAINALNNPVKPFVFKYKLHFKRIFFPETLAAPVESDPEQHATAVNMFFRDEFSCVPFDCIILFTNDYGTDLDFGTPLEHVVILSGSDDGNPYYRVAHEIGHTLGLAHLDIACCAQNTMMCAPAGTNVTLSSCENENLMNKDVFTDINCAQWDDEVLFEYPNDFDCSQASALGLSTDQPFLINGCTNPDRSKVTFTATVLAGISGLTNATLTVQYQDSVYDWNISAPGQDFNHVEVVNQDFNELQIVDTAQQQTAFSLAAQQSRIFRFTLDYNPNAITNPPSDDGRLTVTATLSYMEFGVPVVKNRSVNLKEFVPVSGSIPYFQSNSPVIVTGDLIITNNLLLAAPLILVDNGAAIYIEENAVVKPSKIPAVTIAGCNTMWEGISLHDSATLELKNATIKDAQRGISYFGGSLTVNNCSFLNNNFGITVGARYINITEGNSPDNITLLGNRFATTDDGLRSPYAGQSPIPLEKGFAGIYLRNAGSINIDIAPGSSVINEFNNLKFGIIAKNTELHVSNTVFDSIVQTPKGNGYSEYTTTTTGKAIFAEKGLAYIEKGSGQKLSFINCYTGVESMGATILVDNVMMTRMTNGIIATNSDYSFCQNNSIEATDRGIELRHSSPLAFPSSILPSTNIGGIIDNTITMTGNAKSIAINLAGNKMIAVDPTGAPSNPPQFTGGNIAGNIITFNDGATGININVARKLSAYSNHITLANNQDANRGIALNAGDQNAVTCNTVKAAGTGDYTGLYAIHADRAKLRCNFADATGVGLRVEGLLTGKTKADIAGNLFQDNTTGLLYGVDAISGQQMHRGNRWSGNNTLAEHQGIAAVAIFSKYIIDEAEDTEFLPNFWSPDDWFEDVTDTISSYLCPNLPGVCIRADNLTGDEPDQVLDEKTALGELPGEYYQDAINWLAQRRLYERIAEEGNPYPNNTDITGFLTAAQSNGLAGYADIQTDIRQTLGVSQADQDSLQLYERRILEGLDSLARLEGQLYTLGISEQDSIDLSDQRADLLQMVQASGSAKQNRVNMIDSLRSIAADNLLLQNDNLPDLGKPYTANEKTVNDILLRTVLHGIFTFSSQDSATLESIAALCPLSVGESVLRARALLALVWGTPQSYEDEANCIAERSRREQPATPDQFRIYPNPATDRITVEHSGDETSEQTFILFNALGQVVKTAILFKEQNSTRILLNGVPAGIYWYRVNGMQAAIRSGKIIINH